MPSLEAAFPPASLRIRPGDGDVGYNLGPRGVFVGLNSLYRWYVCRLASQHSCPARRHLNLWRAESQEAGVGRSALPSGCVDPSYEIPLVIHTALAGRSVGQKIIAFTEQLDLIGLVLLGAAVALILLPITLVKTAGQWSDGQ